MTAVKNVKFNTLFIILDIIAASSNFDMDKECKLWSKKHIFPTNEQHYKNITPFLIRFNQYNDLDKNCNKMSLNATILYFYPNQELLIDNDLDLQIFLSSFKFYSKNRQLIFQRVKGFNQNYRKNSVRNSLGNYFITFFNGKI